MKFLFHHKKQIIIVLCIAMVAAFGYVYAVHHGYVLLNHPSRNKYPIRGVDVSHYQGEIDWNTLSQENIQFAYIKATEGSSHVDNKFAYNWEQARQTKLQVGAYHFFSFDSPGITQATNFIQNIGTEADMLPPVIDVEYYADKKVHPPEPESVRLELQSMLDEVQKQCQKTPVIYTTEEVWELYLKGHFDQYPLWIRNVITKPRRDTVWTIWQFTNRGRLKGYQGEEQYIDINVFSGKQNEWQEFAGYETLQ